MNQPQDPIDEFEEIVGTDVRPHKPIWVKIQEILEKSHPELNQTLIFTPISKDPNE